MTFDRMRAAFTTASLRRLLVSLCLAFALWAVVTVAQDPERSRTFANVPLTAG